MVGRHAQDRKIPEGRRHLVFHTQGRQSKRSSSNIMGYLVLARQVDERIVITHPNGTRIEIVVNSFRWGAKKHVRLGIEAPKEFAIHRGEVQKLIDAGQVPEREAGR